MKKLTILFTSILILFKSFSLSAEVYYQSGVFKLSPVLDTVTASTGALVFGTDLILDNVLHLNQPSLSDYDFSSKSNIPELDALLMQPYSKSLHYVSWGTLALGAVTPVMFAVLPCQEWLTVGVMYAETLLWAESLKKLGKFAVNRARPYMYFDGYPEDKVEDGDWANSWPSGHTTMAFTAASFTSYLFCQYFPESKYKWAVVGGSYGLAAATGVLRICSGNHFFTDVISGAILGTAVGLFVPWIHTKDFNPLKKINKDSDIALSPLGFSISFNL